MKNQKLKLGIIGAGSVAQTLAKKWVKHNYEIMLSSRNPQNVDGEQIGVKVGSVKEAAEFGDIILLAVNYAHIDSAIEQIIDLVQGKMVIDATNPLIFDKNNELLRVIPDDALAIDVIQKQLSKAKVTKAFTTLWMGYIEQYSNAKDRKAIPFVANNESEKLILQELVLDLGFDPVYLGGSNSSRPLDPPSPIWNVPLSKEELLRKVKEFDNKHETNLAV